MYIDREKAGKVFEDFLASYDLNNKDIRMKAVHTRKVAENCDAIAEAEGLDRDLAWLLGLVHDIGRFPQLAQFDTFWDLASLDHAEAGAEMLFGSRKMIGLFTDREEFYPLIRDAVRWHSAYRLPVEMDQEHRIYADLLRDADKLDIFRVFGDRPPHEIYRCSEEEFLAGKISEGVMTAIRGLSSVSHQLKKSPVDRYAGILSLIFELRFAKSGKMAEEQGYYQRLFTPSFTNPDTVENIREIRKLAESFTGTIENN